MTAGAAFDHSTHVNRDAVTVVFKVAGLDVSGPNAPTQLPSVDVDTPIARSNAAEDALSQAIAQRKAQIAAGNSGAIAEKKEVVKDPKIERQNQQTEAARKQLEALPLEIGFAFMPSEDDDIKGLVVMDVREDSAADHAGIMQEDIIQEMNNVEVGKEGLSEARKGVKAGDKFPVRLLRALATDSDSYFEDGAEDAEQEFEEMVIEMQVGGRGVTFESVQRMAKLAEREICDPTGGAASAGVEGGDYKTWNDADAQAIAAGRSQREALRELQRQLEFISRENAARAQQVLELEAQVDTLTARNSQLLQEACDYRAGHPSATSSAPRVKRDTAAELRAQKISKAKTILSGMTATFGIDLQHSSDPDVTGWVVMGTVAGGPVDEAGIQGDDVVNQVDGKDVSGKDFKALLGAYTAGDRVQMRIMRAVETDSDSYFDEGGDFGEAQMFDQIDFEVQVGARGYTANEVSRIRAAANGMVEAAVDKY